MVTGQPTTGKIRKRIGCTCEPYHRPISSAQYCQCECHDQ